MIDLNGATGFDWDAGNARKSADRHQVSQTEAEEVFFNQPLLLVPDQSHSGQEARWHAYGKTHAGRLLHTTFTLRQGTLIRVISARPMHKKKGNFMTKRKAIPRFRSEKAEREFWENPKNSSTDFLDLSQAKPAVFPNLKPSTTAISLRLADGLLGQIKTLANKMDVPYQSLMKIWLAEKVTEIQRT
jgi:uncharacterized DUF497 family protein/predicted DNA binding CopG/RHH family protein